MTESVIVAVLALAGTLCGSWLSHRKSAALIAYRLEQLERKVEKHNRLVERTYDLEKAMEVVEEQMKVANHRIADLEVYHR
jgi:hypothetical protein